MAKEDLGLRLSAEITQWVTNLAKAEKSADGLRLTVIALEKSIRSAFASIDSIARQGGLGIGQSFLKAAQDVDTATARMDASTKEAAASFKTLGTAAAASAASVGGSAATIESSVGGIGAATVATGRTTATAFAELEASFEKVGTRIKEGVFSVQNALVGLAAVKLGQTAVSSASEFETALGQVDIVATDSGKSIQELRGYLLDLSKTTPVGLVDLTKSLGDAIGKLPKGANQAATAIEALNAAQLAARASGSSAEQVLSGIIPILNTYGSTGITAAQVTDKLFAAFDQGGATVPELSASLGQIVGIASQFGIGIDELFGEISVLTRGGQTASEAITNLRQALISTARPPENVKKALAELNKTSGETAVEFGVAALKSKGLVGVLEDLKRAGGDGVLEQLFTDTQGFLGVATLLGAGLGQVREDISLIGTASGKTDAAVAKIAGNFDQLAGIAKNKLQVVLISMGEKILPTLIATLDKASAFIEANGEAIAIGFGKIATAALSLGTFIAEHGAAILSFFVAFKAIRFFGNVAKDLGGVTGALGGLLGTLGKTKNETDKGLTIKPKFEFDADGTAREVKAAGEDIGAALVDGIEGEAEETPGLLSSILASPSALAGIVASGIEIGTALGNAIGSYAADVIYGPIDKAIRANIEELDKRLVESLKKFGGLSLDQVKAAQDRRAAGEVVAVEGPNGTTLYKSLADIKAGVGELASTAANGVEAVELAAAKGFEFLDKASVKAADNLNAAKNELEQVRNEIADLDATAQARLNAPGSNPEAVARIEQFSPARLAAIQKEADAVALVTTQQGALNAATAARNNLQANYDRLRERDAKKGASGDIEAAAKTAKASADAAKAAQNQADKDYAAFLKSIAEEYEAGQKRITDAQAATEKATLETARINLEKNRDVFNAETEQQEQLLKQRGASESEIRAFGAQRLQDARAFTRDAIGLANAEASAAIEAAERKAQADIDAAQGAADQKEAIQEALEAEVTRILAEAESKRTAITLEEARTRAKLGADAKVNAEKSAQERLAQLQLEERVISNPLGNIDETSRLLGGGALPPEAQLITKAPAIAGGIADLIGGDTEGIQRAIDSVEADIKFTSAKIEELRLKAAAEEDAVKKSVIEGQLAQQETRLPELQSKLDGLNDSLENARSGIEKWFDDLAKNGTRFLESIATGIPSLIERLLTNTIPKLIPVFIRLFVRFTVGLPFLVVTVVKAVAKALFSVQFWKDLFSGIAAGVVGAFRDTFGEIVDAITSDAAAAVGRFFQQLGKDFITAIGAPVADFFAMLYDGFVGFFEDVFEAIKEFFGLGKGEGDSDSWTPSDTSAGGLASDIGGAFVGSDKSSRASRIGAAIATGGASEVVRGGRKLGEVLGLWHQGGMVNGGSNPGAAMALHAAGAQHFADGGMVAPASSLARRRMSQILRGDDIPALLAPGEGVLTAKGVDAAGGPTGVDSLNRGNGGGSQAAQIVLSTQVGGDRALAALITRIVKVSVMSPHGNVRAGIDQINRATRVPAFAGLKGT